MQVRCTGCGQDKAQDQFAPSHVRGASGLCRACNTKQAKEWRHEHLPSGKNKVDSARLICSICQTEKVATEYRWNSRTGFKTECKECEKTQLRCTSCKEVKKHELFPPSKQISTGRHSLCNACFASRALKSYYDKGGAVAVERMKDERTVTTAKEREVERVRKIKETTRSTEFREMVSKRQKAYQADPDWKQWFIEQLVGTHTPESIERQAEAVRKCWADPEWRTAQIAKFKAAQTPERRAAHAEMMRAHFADPLWQKKYWEIMHRHPNGFETRVGQVLETFGFRFTGDFSFWVGVKGGVNMNPDFIHFETKTVVEALGDPWHEEDEVMERAANFDKAGWLMIPIWQSEFDADSDILVKRVTEMMTNRSE